MRPSEPERYLLKLKGVNRIACWIHISAQYLQFASEHNVVNNREFFKGKSWVGHKKSLIWKKKVCPSKRRQSIFCSRGRLIWFQPCSVMHPVMLVFCDLAYERDDCAQTNPSCYIHAFNQNLMLRALRKRKASDWRRRLRIARIRRITRLPGKIFTYWEVIGIRL